MRRMKGTIGALLVLTAVFGASIAEAGIPVIDSANLTQAIQQVLAWGQQAVQMGTQISNQATQINNQVTHIQAITGSRNLGQTYNNTQLQQIVSADTPAVMNAINAQGYSGLTDQALSIRNTTMLYNCMDKPAGQLRTTCQALLNGLAQGQANSATALNIAQQRVTEIQNIQNQINTTQDPKAVAEVQAALMAEQAQVQNDMLRFLIANQMQDMQAKQAEQTRRETHMNMLSPTAHSTFDNYSFK
jgi:type IV secretion system protein VirB5